MGSIGWGVVGLGRIVNTTIAPAILEDPHSELVAGVSRDQGRADAFAERFGAPFAYTEYEELLSNPRVDAVFVATPNALHAPQVIEAARAGKHVLCDKPIAVTVEDGVDEVAACADAGVRFGVNFDNRRLAWVQDVRGLIADGEIGEVLTVDVEVSAGRNPPKDWRADPSLAGLGTTYNIGVHAFDFLRCLLGSDPVEVVAMFDDEGGTHRVETEAQVLMRFANGSRVHVNCNQNSPFPQNSIAIYGTAGRIVGSGLTRARQDGVLTVSTSQGEVTRRYEQRSGLSHHRSLAAFARCVVDDEAPDPSGVDGLHSVLLCDAIAHSIRDRRVVEVDYTPLMRLP